MLWHDTGLMCAPSVTLFSRPSITHLLCPASLSCIVFSASSLWIWQSKLTATLLGLLRQYMYVDNVLDIFPFCRRWCWWLCVWLECLCSVTRTGLCVTCTT